jgi:hypothetical protein
MLDLNSEANFMWNFSKEFFLETPDGNYVWSDPNYGGDNTIRKFDGTLNHWLNQFHVPYVRCKGRHKIGDYCGQEVNIIR